MSGILDHLSKELQAEYTKPRANEIRIYELTGITKKKSKDGVSAYTVPVSRSIPDSYTIIDGDETKSMVYTTNFTPTDDPLKVRRVVDPIEFLQVDMGRIRITPENYPTMANIDKFLFFSPWLVASRDADGVSNKPWQVRDKLGQFFRLLDSRGAAIQDNLADDMITDAKIAIRDMEESDLDIFILQMKLGLPKYLVLEEKMNMLKKAVSNPQNAKRLLSMINEEDMEMRRSIDLAVSQNIISKHNNSWSFVEGEEVIMKKMPSKTMEDSLIFYFKTESGGEVKLLIEKTIEAKSKNKASNPKKEKKLESIYHFSILDNERRYLLSPFFRYL
jgi:hypothetical protein